MVKTFVKVAGIILLLIAVGLVVLSVSLNSTIKAGVESIGPTITGTEVTLESVDLSLFTGEGRLEKLVIGNPPGFGTDDAFSLGVVHIKVDLNSLLSDTVHIQDILIDSPEISFEGTPSGSNIGIIHENIESFGGSVGESVGEKSGQEGRSQEEPSKEKKIQIDQFILKNGRFTVSTPLLKEHLFTILLPVVHLRDIGKQPGGATLKEISSLIYSETQKAIEQEISKNGILWGPDLKKLDKKLGGIIKEASKFLEGFKGLFGN
jgi:uncharacterized protein involved in outer membrane biogenesis